MVHSLAMLEACIKSGSQLLTDTSAKIARESGATSMQVHATIAHAGGQVLA
ncbi:MAG: hypothetical protein H7099_11655 [Gemmatimonadaceae bacterium]|nr:hypothetical protein [Gemmatimonadaceae bacterium]